MATRNSNGKALHQKVQIHEDGSKEYWRDVVGYEGKYRVSDWGRVKSLSRLIVRNDGVRLVLRERILRPGPTSTRHLTVALRRNGKSTSILVHRLVLEAFDRTCPEGMEGCHKDGVRGNNRLDNLRWDTRKGNCDDDLENGARDRVRGSNNQMSVLTEEKVRRIRSLYIPRKFGCRKLGMMFGVSDSTIMNVVRRNTWSWLD